MFRESSKFIGCETWLDKKGSSQPGNSGIQRLLFLFWCSENRLVHKGLQNRPIPHEILRVLTFWVIKTDKRLCLAFSLLCASGSLSKRSSFFNGTWRWSSLEWEGTTSNSRMLIRISLWLKWLGPWNTVSGTLSSQGFS